MKQVPTDEILRGVTFTRDAFIAVGDFGTALRSRDGVHWKVVLDGSKRGLASVTYEQGSLWPSAPEEGSSARRTGNAGRPSSPRPGGTCTACRAGPGGIVAVGAKGVLLISPNGRRWLRWSRATHQNLRTVTVLGGRWYAAGDGGVVLSSADGIKWRPEAKLAPFSVRQLAEGNGLQVAAGAGIIATRPGAGPWALNPAGDYRFKTGVAFGHGLFVVVGHAGGIVSSTDGDQWTPAPIDTVENLDAIAHGPGLWVTSGLGLPRHLPRRGELDPAAGPDAVLHPRHYLWQRPLGCRRRLWVSRGGACRCPSAS